MNTAWIGLVADGGKCFDKSECSSKDSFCAANQTCTAKPTTGQACTTFNGCATGNFCQASVCRTQLAAGQPCTDTFQCMPQHFCDTSIAQSVCTAVRNPGEQCISNTSCKSLQCLPGICSNAPDADCFIDAQCGLGTCEGRVCSQPQIVVDYCEGTLSVIRELTIPVIDEYLGRVVLLAGIQRAGIRETVVCWTGTSGPPHSCHLSHRTSR